MPARVSLATVLREWGRIGCIGFGGPPLGASWRARAHIARWVVYLLAGAAAAATIGEWLAPVLLGCGLIELAAGRTPSPAEPGPPRSGPS